jgi:RES domain-containing protein
VEKALVRGWRITRTKYAEKTVAFNGKGAAENPGRWNKAGVPVVYICSSIALCALETLVHTRSQKALNGRFALFEVEIPVDLISTAGLPADLRARQQTQEIGDRWIKEAQTVVLRVPSVVTGEPNFLLNPNHADFSKIKIGEAMVFHFDRRLLGEEGNPRKKKG